MLSGFRSRSLIVAALAATCASVHAQYIEAGDAGNLPGTAQNASAHSIIRGTLNNPNNPNGFGDEDMFIINIINPAAFSATVAGFGQTPLDDSQLFLFRMNGTGIAHNDDIHVQNNWMSHFPVGNALYNALAPGLYLIGISGFDDDAKDGPGENPSDYIFLNDPGSDPNGNGNVIGPNAGATALIAWDGDAWGSAAGGYEIRMTGVGPVPEPATLAVLGIGAAALLRRRKK